MEAMSEHMLLALRVFSLKSQTYRKNIKTVGLLKMIKADKHHVFMVYLGCGLLPEQIRLSKCCLI